MITDETGVLYSCSALDSAVSGIEEARGLHDELRTVALDALKRVEELELEVDKLETQLREYE